MHAPIPDEALMLRYQEGDVSAFEILYARHKGPLHRYFRRHGAAQALCEEMFQDVWLSLIRNHQSYRVEAKFTTYLYHLAHNRLIDHFRRHARALIDSDEDLIEHVAADRGMEPDAMAELAEQSHRLQAAVASLPCEQREVFLLRAESGLSVEEIAEVLGVPYETTKSRLRYAISKLAAKTNETANSAVHRNGSS